MSKVITFSRTFPSYHPKAGQPTHFVGAMNKALGRAHFAPHKDYLDALIVYNSHLPEELVVDFEYVNSMSFWVWTDLSPKIHTIRSGNRWKAGDWFSPRVWSGVPYDSKQIIIGPDLQIKRVVDIEMSKRGVVTIDGKFYDCRPNEAHPLAYNDGLSGKDLADWFAPYLPFSGQIIIWIDKELPY
jgi:hypothetical protein